MRRKIENIWAAMAFAHLLLLLGCCRHLHLLAYVVSYSCNGCSCGLLRHLVASSTGHAIRTGTTNTRIIEWSFLKRKNRLKTITRVSMQRLPLMLYVLNITYRMPSIRHGTQSLIFQIFCITEDYSFYDTLYMLIRPYAQQYALRSATPLWP